MSFKHHLEEALNPTFRDRSGRPKPKVANPKTGDLVALKDIPDDKLDMEWLDGLLDKAIELYKYDTGYHGKKGPDGKAVEYMDSEQVAKKLRELITKIANKAYREGVRSGKEIGRSEMRGAGEGTHGYGG